MKNRLFNVAILFMIISLISLACKINVGGEKPAETPIPVSEDAADTMKSIIDSATISGTQNDKVAFTVTEEQVTSLAAEQLANNPDYNLTDPQIYLRDGKIDVYAVYNQQYFEATIHLVLSATVDENGQLKVTIEDANLGPIPTSQNTLNTLSGMIDSTITNSLLPTATGFRIESIYIADGMATISGTITQ